MLTTFITETGPGDGFPVQGLITLLVAAVIFYPIQKKVREVAARRRRERWGREGLLPDEGRGGDSDTGGGVENSPVKAVPESQPSTDPSEHPPVEERPV